MSTLYVDFGSRFVRAAGASLDTTRLLRDSRRRQEFVRPPEIVWVRDQPHLFWAAQDVAETMPVDERVSWSGIPTALSCERATPVTLLAMAIARLASEYRAEFAVPVSTIAVVLPWSAGQSEIEVLVQACAVAEIGQLRTMHPALCASFAAGSRVDGTDLVIDVGAGGCRAAWVHWQRGAATLDGVWQESGFNDGSVLAAIRAQMVGAADPPPGVLRVLADRAWRPRISPAIDLRMVKGPQGTLPVALSSTSSNAAMRLLDQALSRLCDRALDARPDFATRNDLRLVLSGGGGERARQWLAGQPRLANIPLANPGATAGVFGLGPALAEAQPSEMQLASELGIEVPRTSRNDRAKGPRTASSVDSVPLIQDTRRLPASGRLADSECGRLAGVARLYQQEGEQRWSHPIELPEGFVASMQPWLELALINSCGPALLIDIRTHLGDTPRRWLLHHEAIQAIDPRMSRWLKWLQQA